MEHKKALLYGLIVWVFPFVVAMLIFPWRSSERALFESVMAVAVTLAATVATVKYFLKTKKKTALVGLCLGLIWMAMSLGLDGLFFSWGPMKMTIGAYIKDIGVAYLIILIIPWGLGWYVEKK